MNTLYNLEVKDRHSFIAFLKLLHSDFQDHRADWENITLDHFLEAMIAHTQDIQGYYDNTGQTINADNPSWRIFADILMGTKIYE